MFCFSLISLFWSYCSDSWSSFCSCVLTYFVNRSFVSSSYSATNLIRRSLSTSAICSYFSASCSMTLISISFFSLDSSCLYNSYSFCCFNVSLRNLNSLSSIRHCCCKALSRSSSSLLCRSILIRTTRYLSSSSRNSIPSRSLKKEQNETITLQELLLSERLSSQSECLYCLAYLAAASASICKSFVSSLRFCSCRLSACC